MAAELGEDASEFARRLWLAMAEEKKSQTRTEREAGLQRGYLSQVKVGTIRRRHSNRFADSYADPLAWRGTPPYT
jgi:hypothetical protein